MKVIYQNKVLYVLEDRDDGLLLEDERSPEGHRYVSYCDPGLNIDPTDDDINALP